MNRYLFSFVLTIILYSSFVVFIFFNTKESINIKKQNTKSGKIAFYVLEERKEVKKIKRIEEVKEIKIKEEVKKIIKTKKIKKNIIKKPVKKVIKKKKTTPKKAILKKETKKILPKKKSFKDVLKKFEEKKLLDKKLKTLINNDIKKEELKKIQNKYYSKIKQTIDKNKYYPKSARRRGIEDRVKITFEISKKGELLSFHILEGKSIFHKSTARALQNSFPLLPPKELRNNIITLTLNLEYNLY